MSFEEKTLKTERIYEGKIINLRVDTVELPERKYSKREIVEHSGGVGILAVNDAGKLVFVKQFRKPIESTLLEIPAGKLEADEPPIDCACRELKEETGYQCGSLVRLTEIYTSPGFSNEIIHLYLAKNLKQGTATPDEDEYIEIIEMTLAETLDAITSGKIKDSKTIIAVLMYAQSHRID